MAEAERKLRQNMTVRDRLFAERDVVKDFAENYDHNRDSSRLPQQLNFLDRSWSGDIDHLDAHLELRCEFEDSFCSLKGLLLSMSSQNRQLHTPRTPQQQPEARSQEAYSERPEPALFIPLKYLQAASVLVADPSEKFVASAATTPTEPNAPRNVSRGRHSSP